VLDFLAASSESNSRNNRGKNDSAFHSLFS
jgi:hypothetical protein